MNPRFRQVLKWLRTHLAGARLQRALDRHAKAAEELDKAVREVLSR